MSKILEVKSCAECPFVDHSIDDYSYCGNEDVEDEEYKVDINDIHPDCPLPDSKSMVPLDDVLYTVKERDLTKYTGNTWRLKLLCYFKQKYEGKVLNG